MKKSYDLPEIKELFLLQYYISLQKNYISWVRKNPHYIWFITNLFAPNLAYIYFSVHS